MPALRGLGRPVAARCLLAGLALLLLALTGCSDVSRSSFDTLKLAVHRQPKLAPSAAEVAAKPYYQMEATGPSGSAVLILGNIDGSRQAWYGRGGVVLFLEHGRLVQSAGLGQNLDGVQLPANDPFARGLQTLTGPVDYRFSEDWSPGYRYDVPVQARLVPAGLESVDILGTPHQLRRIDEQLRAPTAGFQATNHYWIDPHSGLIWKSVQHPAPGLTLQLNLLKPYPGVAP